MFTTVDPDANKPGRSRTRKFLLTVLLLLVAVPVVFLLIEHYRGKRVLAVTLRELQGRGEVLNIARIAPPPVPPASNALDRLMAASAALQAGYGRGPESMRMLEPAVARGAFCRHWATPRSKRFDAKPNARFWSPMLHCDASNSGRRDFLSNSMSLFPSISPPFPSIGWMADRCATASIRMARLRCGASAKT